MKNLTIDYKQMLSLTTKDKLNMTKSTLGQEIMSAMTPSQLASLFPSYYKDNIKPALSVSDAMTGATPMSRSSSGSTYSQSDDSDDSSTPPKRTTTASVAPQTAKNDNAWIKKLEEKAGVEIGDPEEQTYTPGRRIKGGSTIPEGTDQKTIDAVNRVAGKHNLDPAAVSMLIQTESEWKPKSRTGSYVGLTQIGPDTIKEAGWNFTQQEFRNMSPDKQVEVYGDWLDHYKFQDKIANAKIDLSKLTPSQQAAILQGFQFSPNGQKFLKAYGQGNDSVPATRSKQAGALGDTSIAQMTSYYDRLAKKNPALYEDPTAIIPNDPSATGAIMPPQDNGNIQSKFVLPQGTDPNVVKYYDSLTAGQKLKFQQIVNKVGMDEVNNAAKQHAAQTIASAANGKQLATGKSVDLAMGMLGAHEIRDRQKIKEFLKNGGQNLDPKSTAWCGAFVNSAFEQSGVPNMGREGWTASTWQKYGTGVDDPSKVAKGDVLVEHRGVRPGNSGAHVGMATGNTKIKNGRVQIEMLSGNAGPGDVETTWYDARRLKIRRPILPEPEPEAPTAIQDPSAIIPQDPNQTGAIQPTMDNTTVAPVRHDGRTEGPEKAPTDALPPTPTPVAPDPVKPAPEVPMAAAEPVQPATDKRMSQQELWNKFSDEEKDQVKNLKGKQGGEYWIEKAHKYDPAVQATKTTASATQAPTATPTEPEKPKLASGGTVQASGEDFSIVDNNSKNKLAEVSRGENIRFNKKGQVQVTPDRRVDPRLLEEQKEAREDHGKESVETKAKSQEAPVSAVTQVQNQPQPAERFTSREQWGHTPTPNSFVRAMEQAKGRKNSGMFAGSRFGEEQGSNLT